MLDMEQMQERAMAELDQVDSSESLDAWRQAYLGRTGQLTAALRGIGQLPADERPAAGQLANQVRQTLTMAFEERERQVKANALATAAQASALDVRLPGRPPALGHVHVINQALREIYAIFAQMGFSVFQTREVEDDTTNFQLLNIPPDHPARDMWSTFYTTTPGVLLRTHTSPGQIHAMRKFHPDPFRVILPGKCYRYEQVTTRSEHMFHQVEGLVIGRAYHHGRPQGRARVFRPADVRRRIASCVSERAISRSPSPAPRPMWTARSAAEQVANSASTPVGSRSWAGGWCTRRCSRNGGYDPDIYTGFAFGMGPERMALLKYGINDIRLLYARRRAFSAAVRLNHAGTATARRIIHNRHQIHAGARDREDRILCLFR